MRTIVYYVSGHGFGHGRRTAPVLRRLVEMRQDLRVVVRTAAPRFLFEGVDRCEVSRPEEVMDPGVVERDALTIDAAASVARLAKVVGRAGAIVENEAGFLREVGAELVVADVPFLAGDAAEAVGVDCVAVGNFTWDWIFEPFVGAAERELVGRIRQSYGKMAALLRLPLGHEVDCFREVVDVPLLANRAVVDRAETLGRLGVEAGDRRPRVLVAMRGGLSEEALVRAAAGAPDLLFLVTQGVRSSLANLRVVEPTAGVAFTELLAACDVAVSKLGYGIVSDCIANGVALLFPPRVGFREDEVSRAECPRYLRMREISAAEFAAGEWGAALRELLGQAVAAERISVEGDRVIAGRLLEWLEGRRRGERAKGRGGIRTHE